MSIRSFLKSLGGRAGNKTRSRGKVNTERNKRAAAKADRRWKEEIAWLQKDDLFEPYDYDEDFYH